MGADYYAPIGPAEGDLEIVKHRHSGLVATSLDLALRSMGVKTVVLGGVASNLCVEATARDAADYDYYVVVLSDASGAVRDELHEASLYTIQTYIGRVVCAADVTQAWAAAAAPAGR
jgi:ureidoacrylate peracid hydrolase